MLRRLPSLREPVPLGLQGLVLRLLGLLELALPLQGLRELELLDPQGPAVLGPLEMVLEKPQW